MKTLILHVGLDTSADLSESLFINIESVSEVALSLALSSLVTGCVVIAAASTPACDSNNLSFVGMFSIAAPLCEDTSPLLVIWSVVNGFESAALPSVLLLVINGVETYGMLLTSVLFEMIF